MAKSNLTETQAIERADLLKIHSYEIEIDVTDGAGNPSEGTFRSITKVSFTAREPGESSWIELIAPRVHRATLNGEDLDITSYTEENGIALPGLKAENVLVIDADCEYSNTGKGLHRFVDPADDNVYLYTHFEPADAKRVFACFDQPDLKATYRLSVTAPASWKVLSNTETASTEETASGAKLHVFNETKPLSTYLIALIAGPYAEWRDQHGEIPLGLYCRASLAEHFEAERLFLETKQGFGFFQEKFGIDYPFEKYDQCYVPEFSSGAMENAGCVTFNDMYVFRSRVTDLAYEYRCYTILHEMAHMWFGDLVTMKWWNDLWLNESFATWAGYLAQSEATKYKNAWTSFNCLKKTGAYRQDQLPSTHPIMCEIPDLQATEVNFDQITYSKGASALKQLVTYVGLENFLTGLRAYLTKHAWGNATLADLLSALEEASGRDLSNWRDQWLLTTGSNVLKPEFEVDSDGNFTTFVVSQGPAKPGKGELRPHRLAVGIYDDEPNTGKLVRSNRIELDVQGASTSVPELVGAPSGKIVIVNDDDLTYGTMRLSSDSLKNLTERIADIAEPLPRTLCWSAAWDMTREAELRTRDYLKLVLSGVETESEITVAQRTLGQARVALGSYADPSWEADGWKLFTTKVFEFVAAAKPGSDHQLAFVNAISASVLTKEQLVTVDRWLSGSEKIDGLDIDVDLRWRLLQTLVAHGAADEKDIDLTAKLDKTGEGQEQQAAAKALIPTLEAKEKAWQLAMHDDQLSRAINQEICLAFFHQSQKELLKPFTERYFQDVEDMWNRRSIKHANPAVANLYPMWDISQKTVALAEDWLSKERPSALKRLVSEEHSIVLRGLAAQKFDAS
jgi:aminopeptidase N